MITSLLTKRISAISYSEKHLSQFYPQDGGESQLALKLRNCHPMYRSHLYVLHAMRRKTQQTATKQQIDLPAKTNVMPKLEGKYSLESTDPRESEIRAPPQPLPYLIPIPPNTLFITNSTY